MFLGEVRAGGRASIDLVDLGPRDHIYSVLNGAHGVADCASCAVFLDDRGESVVAVKLDGLIAGVSACKEATTALETLVFVNHRSKELFLGHLIDRRDVLQLGADEVQNRFR